MPTATASSEEVACTRVTSGKQHAAQKGDILGRIPHGYDRVFFDEHGKEVYRCAAGSGFKCPDNWTGKLAISTSGRREIMPRF